VRVDKSGVVTGRVGWPDDDPGLLAAVAGFYRAALAGSLEAQGWLERHRLADDVGLETFGVGFSDRTLGLSLPVKVRGRDDDVRGRLQQLGVLRPSGHEHFRGCVTLPVADTDGAVVQVFGRTLLDDARLVAGRDRWLPPARRGVWNLGGLDNEVIVCGGIIDAFTWWCAGFRSVTACDGPAGFGDEMAEMLVERGVGRVVVAFDADTAGDTGAREVAGRLGRAGVSCARVGLPRGLGVNAVAVRAKQPTDVLGRLLRRAVWIDSTPPPPSRSRPTPPPQAGLPEAELGAPPLPSAEQSLGVVVDGELQLVMEGRRWRVRGWGGCRRSSR